MGEVGLGRAVPGHVGASLGGVQIHEQAAALARLLAAHLADVGQHAVAVVDVCPARKGRSHPLRAVGPDHLLGPCDQGDVAAARPQPLHGQPQGGGARGAGVLNIDYRDAGQAQRAQGDLAAHGVLALQHGLAGVGEPGGLDMGSVRPRVGQRRAHSLGGQRLDALVQPLAQRRHADPGDEDLCGHAAGRRRCTMRNREATKARSARHALPAGFRPET